MSARIEEEAHAWPAELLMPVSVPDSAAQALKRFGVEPSVLARWGLSVSQVTPVREALRLETPSGPKALKKVAFNRRKMLHIYCAIEHLAANGFTQVSRLLPTLDGDICVSDRTSIIYVSDWIEGREVDFRNRDDVLESARTLGRLHAAGRQYTPLPGALAKHRWATWPEKMRTRLMLLKRYRWMAAHRPRRTEFDNLFLTHADYWYHQGLQALDLLGHCQYPQLMLAVYREGLLTHHDYTYHNLIRTPDGRIHVIDFDYAKYDFRAYDLGNLVLKVVKRHRWDASLAQEIIRAYEETQPLGPEEVPLLLALFYFPQRAFRIADRYYMQKRNWPEAQFVRKLQDQMKVSEPKSRFVQAMVAWASDRLGRPAGSRFPDCPVPPVPGLQEGTCAGPTQREREKGKQVPPRPPLPSGGENSRGQPGWTISRLVSSWPFWSPFKSES